MAIETLVAVYLFQLVPQDNFIGKKIITLGNQKVKANLEVLKKNSNEFAINNAQGMNSGEAFIKYFGIDSVDRLSALNNIIDGEAFFKYFGAKQVESLDVSDRENATIIYDLNSEDLPQTLHEQFDVVYDGGTIEHVFNIKNAFKNIINMVRVNGIIIHHTPANNYMNHGFYQPSPTLFMDFYEANGFKVEILKLFIWPLYPPEFSKITIVPLESAPYYDYFSDPENMQLKGAMEIFCVARKLESRDTLTIPTQRYYANSI